MVCLLLQANDKDCDCPSVLFWRTEERSRSPSQLEEAETHSHASGTAHEKRRPIPNTPITQDNPTAWATPPHTISRPPDDKATTFECHKPFLYPPIPPSLPPEQHGVSPNFKSPFQSHLPIL
mmetsp:Transcript_27747/g.79875  ORF Transcript_27747/g.79875 Transcript_27747/m.79875 type:complete len:122 (+) Transcript_27747:919-1284(+)